MFSEIEKIVFPDCCEVIQLAPQQFVFPIMKNGSSSFYAQIEFGWKPDWKIIRNHDICNITSPVITFLREPKARFISGVNTYVYYLLRDNSGLDVDTILWFVDNYLFLNQHYCPQFFWLVNFSRYSRPDTLLDLRTMSDLDAVAGRNIDPGVDKPSDEILDKIDKFNWSRLDLYMYLDQVLLELAGKTLTYSDILEEIKKRKELYDLIFARSKSICNQL